VTLSKEHLRITISKTPKRIPYLRTEHLKRPTLSGGTYLYSVYKEVPPPPGEKGEDEQPVACSEVIHNELDKIVKVSKGNVKTVKIILPIISGVKDGGPYC